MPALKVLGQPMLFAAEDLRIVSVGALLLRILQIALLIPAMVYVLHLPSPEDVKSVVDNDIDNGSGSSPSSTTITSQYGRELIVSYWSLATFTAVASICLEVLM